MIPAKNRERKCSTCKHYQASPLWRKGWCRNPLLYDRNTNHLVEADSLACNRTFIDYWEPVDDRAAAQGGAGPQARGTSGTGGVRSMGTTGPKPRIAPSIPLDTVDATGAPIYALDSTPALGSTPPARQRGNLFKPLTAREQASRPPLSLVDEGYDELEPVEPADPKVTAKMPQVSRERTANPRISARDRIQQARHLGRPAMSQMSGPRLWIALGVVGLIIAALAAMLLMNRRATPSVGNNNTPVASGQEKTNTLPTPTGIGDFTPTSSVPPTVPAVAASPVAPSKIAVNGYVKVVNTGDGLVIRGTPSRTGARLTKVLDGTKLHVIDGPREAEGFTWWKVDGFNPQSPDTSGWCVQTYLSPTTAP